MIDDLASTFAAERAQIEADVTAFLQDLADKGMVALADPEAPGAGPAQE